MTDIPVTSDAFGKWLIDQDKTEWPEALLANAERARLSLQSMEARGPSEAGIGKVMDEANKKDLQDFAAAYAEWKR